MTTAQIARKKTQCLIYPIITNYAAGYMPNEETIAALKEAEDINKLTTCLNLQEMFDACGVKCEFPTDPFYSRTNMAVLRNSIEEANEGKFVVKTLDELKGTLQWELSGLGENELQALLASQA